MKLYYYPETDSLYVEFQRRPSVDTREISPDVRLDLDDQGRPIGLDIDDASTVLDLETLRDARASRRRDAASAASCHILLMTTSSAARAARKGS